MTVVMFFLISINEYSRGREEREDTGFRTRSQR